MGKRLALLDHYIAVKINDKITASYVRASAYGCDFEGWANLAEM